MWLLPADLSGEKKRWLSEFIRLYGYVGSDDQRWAYVISVIAVAVFSAVAFFLSGRGAIANQKLRFAPRLGVAACIILTGLGLSIYGLFVPTPVAGGAAAIAVLFLLFVLAAPRLGTPVIERTATALIGAYVVVLTVPGLLVKPIPLMEIDPVALVQFEVHMLYLPCGEQW